MTLINWRARNTLPNVSTFFDNFFRDDNGFLPSGFGKDTPLVNVSEEEKFFKVEVAAPGMQRSDFDVSVEKNMLVIRSEREEETEDENKNWTRKEYNYSSFSRSFWLPEDVDSEKISASYQDGILSISIPKNETAIKKTRTIEIK